MPQTTLIIHIVPIQVSFTGSTVSITCDDPRATPSGEEIEFNLTPLGPRDLHVHQRVRFVVQDPNDSPNFDNYINMFSGPPLGQLVAWKRKADVSRSPKMSPGHDFDIVAVAYSAPQGGSQSGAPVKIGRGRRRLKIRDSGGDGNIKY